MVAIGTDTTIHITVENNTYIYVNTYIAYRVEMNKVFKFNLDIFFVFVFSGTPWKRRGARDVND